MATRTRTVRIRGGYLKVGGRRDPEHPDIGLPVEPDNPDDGDEDGEDPGHPDIPPPPGIWPPPTEGHPIQPLPTGSTIPPGAIWPRPPGPVEGKFVALAYVPEHGWHFVVIDPDAWPEPDDEETPTPAPATRATPR